MLPDDDWFEVVKMVNSYKDEINQSSQKIISKLNGSDSNIDIDKELVNILTSLGKIGTCARNSRGINRFANEWYALVMDLKAMNGDWGQLEGLKLWLGKVCMISFEVKKRWWNKNLTINLPDIDIILQQVKI